MSETAGTIGPTTLAASPARAAAANFGHRLFSPGDPLSGASFDAIYEQTVKPELVDCEASRRKALTTFATVLSAALVGAFAEVLLLPGVMHVTTLVPVIDIAVFTVVIGLVLAYLPLRRVAQRAKSDVITALCSPIGVAYALKGAEAPDFDRFLDLRLLPRPSGKSFEDFFSGRRGASDFSLCEATLSQGSGKSRHTVFRGQLFRLSGSRQRLATTVVLRNTGWLNRFECPAGLAKVGLEDPKFDQIFAVFGSDQVEAREILTPAFMQELCDLEAAYAGSHLRCAFVGGELLLAIEGANRFEIGSMFSSLVERSRVEGIARDIEQVFKLIDEFAAA